MKSMIISTGEAESKNDEPSKRTNNRTEGGDLESESDELK